MRPQSFRVMNLAHFLTQSAQRFSERIALDCGEQTYTWRAFDDRVSALAAAFRSRGVAKGDRILVHARNGNEILEVMFGAYRLGAVFVPTNHRLLPDEVAYFATQSGAAAFVYHSEFAEHREAVEQVRPDLGFSVEIGGSGADAFEALIEGHRGAAVPNVSVERDDPCWFFYTSGTTGRPKAAVLTHGQMGYVVTNHLCDLMPRTTEEDVSLVVAPLSHGAGIHALTQVARGAKSILPTNKHLAPEEVWGLVAHHRVSNMFTVPTILKTLVEHPAIDKFDHSSLRYVIYAGSPMYREDQKRALGVLGPVLVQYFGLGEVTGNITVLPPALHAASDGPETRTGTCGFERTAMEVQIQDTDGHELGSGQQGEICVCGPAVFAGYWNDTEANANAFRNGWFRTGDLGYLDDQRFLYITGRASDMYISGGSNVYPREIEEKILIHPAVTEVAVFGIPDASWGEVGVAACVLRKGSTLSESELMAFLDGKVARYKQPKQVLFRSSLPKSGYGKITKKQLREELEREGLIPRGHD